MLGGIPRGRALAADIAGVDLAEPLTSSEFGAIHRAWMTHLVLRFRGQSLTDEQLMNFSRNFGALDGNPRHAKVEGQQFSMRPSRNRSRAVPDCRCLPVHARTRVS